MDTESVWNEGPDKHIPCDNYIATRLDQPVKLRVRKEEEDMYPSMSLYSMFKKTVELKPDHEAIAFKLNPDDSYWTKWTFFEYWNICEKASKSFIKIGLNPSECVALIGFNTPQWFVSILGAMFAGGIGCGMYATNTAEACEFILKDTNAQIVVVENKQQLEKILKCKNNNIPIKKIIQYSGSVENNQNGLVMSWEDFLEYGEDVPKTLLESRVKTIAPNKCATLIYTSGTTGNPKAAMTSHDAITFGIRYIGDICGLLNFEEVFLTFLPLSHIAAQSIDIFVPLFYGITVYFAQPDVLKGTLAKTLKEVRPTYIWGVPRVWEKIQEGIIKETKNLAGIKLALYEWARRVMTDNVVSNFHGSRSNSYSYKIAKYLIIDKILIKLGFDRCRNFFSGAAPITKETLDFFIGLGIPLCEAYGLSESTGPHNIGTTYCNRVGSIGPSRAFYQSKIFNPDEDGAGELAVCGRHVFMGYLNNEEKTREILDDDGWLHTGDLGKIEDEFVYITGRLKELIITAGGENIPPVPIEDNIKAELPDLISNCMLVGDKKKYLVILVTLKSKINLDTMEPMDELTDICTTFLKSIGSNATTVSEIVNSKDSAVNKAIENGIIKANEKSMSRAAKVQKFAILPRDFSLANGELGPTLKLRRPIVAKMYAKLIDELYKDSNGSSE